MFVVRCPWSVAKKRLDTGFSFEAYPEIVSSVIPAKEHQRREPGSSNIDRWIKGLTALIWIPDLALRGSSGMTDIKTLITKIAIVKFQMRSIRAVFSPGCTAGFGLCDRLDLGNLIPVSQWFGGLDIVTRNPILLIRDSGCRRTMLSVTRHPGQVPPGARAGILTQRTTDN